jgi:hypothetical protein
MGNGMMRKHFSNDDIDYDVKTAAKAQKEPAPRG